MWSKEIRTAILKWKPEKNPRGQRSCTAPHRATHLGVASPDSQGRNRSVTLAQSPILPGQPLAPPLGSFPPLAGRESGSPGQGRPWEPASASSGRAGGSSFDAALRTQPATSPPALRRRSPGHRRLPSGLFHAGGTRFALRCGTGNLNPTVSISTYWQVEVFRKCFRKRNTTLFSIH